MYCCYPDLPMADFSYYRGYITTDKVPHFYCGTCGKRFHDGTWYTAEEWFFHINEVTYEEWNRMAQEQELQDLHQGES